MFTEFKLHPQLLKALESQQFSKATPVQEQAIPKALENQDLMVCAETGSGKTAAFLIPTIQRLLDHPTATGGTRALILTPTRELARQIQKQCEALTKHTSISSDVITGGKEFKYQSVIFRKNPEIIIATPGRLLEHLTKKNDLMQDVEVLILDEADRMLDMGFSEDVLSITGHCPTNRQTMLFSATLQQRGLAHVIKQTTQDPLSITVDSIRGEHSSIRQQYLLADDDKHKQRLLTWLLSNETYRQCIIFTNTRVKTEELYHFLAYHKINAGMIHGEISQDERNHVMQRMRQNHFKVMVATDVAARGLDVKEIDLVINFDMPWTGDEYVHRIGRTGRAGQSGLAISMIDSTEWNLKASTEKYLAVKMESRAIQSLKGLYKGPKKVKNNGKAAGLKKTKLKNKAAKKDAKGNKAPNKKRPQKDRNTVISDGSTPFKPRKKTEG